MTARAQPSADALVCPRCEKRYPDGAKFCSQCGIPLVHEPTPGAVEPTSEAHQRARKIKPQLAEGPLVRVAGARNQPEAEFIQGLLLEEGVPSVLRRTAGFDVPDFLAAGPRDVLVAQSGLATAREVLLEAELIDPDPSRARPVDPRRLLLGLLAALVVGVLLVWGVASLLAH